MKLKRFVAAVLSAVMLMSIVSVPSRNISLIWNEMTASAVEYGTYEALEYSKYDDHIEITGCDASATEVEIPSKIDGIAVTKIFPWAFQYAEKLTSVIIPDSITTIGSYAFINTALKSVTIPKNVTSMGLNIFKNTRSLTEITVNKNNPNFCDIDGVLFSKDKTELISYPIGRSDSSYIIPDSVTNIWDAVFFNCSKLTNVTIPDDLKIIGEEVFYATPFYKSLKNDSGFYILNDILLRSEVTDVENLTIPANIKVIAGGAFAPVKKVSSSADDGYFRVEEIFNCKTITFEDEVYINDYAFENIDTLTDVIINSDCTIGSHGFHFCKDLCNITINGNCKLGSNFVYGTNKVETIKINGDCIADSYAFSGCYYCKLIEISGNCTLGAYAFPRCSNKDNDILIGGDCFADENAFSECGASNLIISGVLNASEEMFSDYYKSSANVEFSYNRNSINYHFKDNTNNLINISKNKTVSLEDIMFNTYTEYNKNTIYMDYTNFASHARETSNCLQEMYDSSGEIYAVYVNDLLNSPVSIISKNKETIFNIEHEKGFYFRGATIGEDDFLYVFWSVHLLDSNNLDTENIKICKYSLTGKLINSIALSANITNTYYSSGQQNIIYNNGVLCCLFGKVEARKGTDGNYHQSTTSLTIDAENMKLINVNDHDTGHCWVSSIISTDYGFAAAQLSDAGPRGIVLTKYFKDKDFSHTNNTHTKVYNCSGQYGTNENKLDGNATYTDMGGIAKSESTYAIAGKSERVYTSAVYKESGLQTGNYDVFVKICDQTLYDSPAKDCAGVDRIDEETGEVADKNVIWLTKCNEKEIAGSVKIVTLEDGSYCVLWEKFIDNKFDSIRYVILDECGYTLRRETAIYGARLSNTSIQPIVQGDTLTWAVADANTSSINWYSVDLNDFSTTPQNNMFGDANCDDKVTIADATAILQALGNPDKYGLSEQGAINADCCNNGDGVLTNDALAIQMVDAGLLKQEQLPIAKLPNN